MSKSIILQASVKTGGWLLVVTYQNYYDAWKLVATCKCSKIRCYGNTPTNIYMPFILKINYARKGCANAIRAFFPITKCWILCEVEVFCEGRKPWQGGSCRDLVILPFKTRWLIYSYVGPGLTLKSALCRRSVLMYFIWLKTAVVSLCYVNHLVFLTDVERHEFLPEVAS
jgi:hypothetical protein